MKNNLSTKEGG